MSFDRICFQYETVDQEGLAQSLTKEWTEYSEQNYKVSKFGIILLR